MADNTAIATVPAFDRLPAIPAGWEAKAMMIDQCIGAGQRLGLWLAVLVAESRQDVPDASEWLSRCTTRWGWQKAHVHHLAAIGDLLGKARGRVWCTTLCALPQDILLALTRLPEHLVPRFCQDHRVRALLDAPAASFTAKRAAVRAAVDAWLVAAGEPPIPLPASGGSPTPPAETVPAATTQADFLDLLFAASPEFPDLVSWSRGVKDRAAAVSDPAAARTAAVRALICVDALLPQIAPAESGKVAQALRDLADAASAHAAGLVPHQRSPR